MVRRNRRRILNLVLGVLAAAAVVIYLLASLQYKRVYLPNTVINGIQVSGMTAGEVKLKIKANANTWQLTLKERNHKTEQIHGSDIGLRLACEEQLEEGLEEILSQQKPLLWGIRSFRGKAYQKDCTVSFDRDKLKAAVESLSCLNTESLEEPADAYITWDQNSGLQIAEEKQGNWPVTERLLAVIEEAVISQAAELSLEESGVYKKPQVLKDDDKLAMQLEKWKIYANKIITYRFGSSTETLDGGTIYKWLLDDDTGNTALSREKVYAYVQGLAEKYNTAYCAKQLKTSYGPTVTIAKGSYGWMIDKEAETNALLKILESGESQEREPVYLQTAASHNGPDYGNTYVEMNLTAQHLFFYKDGELLVESDFVSGNEAKGFSTPEGAYGLTYKQRDATLRGKTYRTPVTYWMPFNGNIGMHDGYWRSSFGGTIYKNNGSHGCVNLPPSVAELIFTNIEAGDPVLCYHLEGTEKGESYAN